METLEAGLVKWQKESDGMSREKSLEVSINGTVRRKIKDVSELEESQMFLEVMSGETIREVSERHNIHSGSFRYRCGNHAGVSSYLEVNGGSGPQRLTLLEKKDLVRRNLTGESIKELANEVGMTNSTIGLFRKELTELVVEESEEIYNLIHENQGKKKTTIGDLINMDIRILEWLVKEDIKRDVNILVENANKFNYLCVSLEGVPGEEFHDFKWFMSSDEIGEKFPNLTDEGCPVVAMYNLCDMKQVTAKVKVIVSFE